MAKLLAALVALAALTATAADRPTIFTFDPKPRWDAEPETEEICRAVAAECAAMLKDGQIEAEWAYSEIYDADGYLVGIRSRGTSGCKALDEYLMLSHRDFRGAFSSEGKPDLDDFTVETAPGIDRSGVRLVKTGQTSASIGC